MIHKYVSINLKNDANMGIIIENENNFKPDIEFSASS